MRLNRGILPDVFDVRIGSKDFTVEEPVTEYLKLETRNLKPETP